MDFASKQDMAAHAASAHKFDCGCGMSFKSQADMKRHAVEAH
jgi:hypothetical protein